MTTASSRYSVRISSSASLRFIFAPSQYVRRGRLSRGSRLQVAGDGFEVLGNRQLRRRLIVAHNGLEDAPVAFEGDLRPLDRPEQPRLRVLEQPVDDLHDALDDRIVRGASQEVVELGIFFRAGEAFRHALFLPAYDVFESLQILRCGAGGRRPRYLWLEEEPRVHELLAKRSHAVEHAGDRGHKVLDRDLPDVVAPAVTALHEARYLELAYGLPYHGAAYLELLGEPPLRGQRLARTQLSAGYEVPDPRRHLLVELDAPDRCYGRLCLIRACWLHAASLTPLCRTPPAQTRSAPSRRAGGGRSRRIMPALLVVLPVGDPRTTAPRRRALAHHAERLRARRYCIYYLPQHYHPALPPDRLIPGENGL